MIKRNPNTNEYLERLVDSLMYAFRIQNDDSLIQILGTTGQEKTNQDALRNWISSALMYPDFDMAERVLPSLITQLENRLRLTQPI